MIINGKEENICDITVTELLELKGLKKNRVAIELNGAILKKDEYDTRNLKNEDKMEIVTFVGGG